MNKYHHSLIPSERSPLITLLLLFACLIASYFVASFLSIIPVLIKGGTLDDMMSILSNPIPENWWTIMTMQLIIGVFIFIVTPIIFIKYILGTSTSYLFHQNRKGLPQGVLLAVLATFCFMVFNTILIEWNSNMVLPDFMSGVESYIREQEDTLAELTNFLVTFSETEKFLFTLLIIGVVPAVGEELLFRGVLQTNIEKIIKNPHVAIVVTAILFSAFHMQFYGFLPRAALGILFGYLFYYSSNLIYPMVAHFLNNGLTVTMVYLKNSGAIEIDIENTETPSTIVLLGAFLIGFMLLFIFKKNFIGNRS